jgi:lipopolysaccharide assembly protein B
MLYERSREWSRAIDVASRIEAAGGASLSSRVAHYWCELSQAAEDRGESDQAEDALQRARRAEPTAVRPLVMVGRRHVRQGDKLQALAAWDELRRCQSASFALVAAEYVDAALGCGRESAALDALTEQAQRQPGVDVLRALARLQPDDVAGHRQRLLEHLNHQPTLSAALDVLADETLALQPDALPALRGAIAAAARPLQRYRCAACGFEAQHWFWQCPGCLAWDSYPPRRIEEQ